MTVLYPHRVVIPAAVYAELSNPCTPHLKARIDKLLKADEIRIRDIHVGTEAFKLYQRLTIAPGHGKAVIGKGEAAALALARDVSGIVASNNLKDISNYVLEFGLRHITTGDILHEALKRNIISLEQGERLWGNMLSKRRKLGFSSFAAFLQTKRMP